MRRNFFGVLFFLGVLALTGCGNRESTGNAKMETTMANAAQDVTVTAETTAGMETDAGKLQNEIPAAYQAILDQTYDVIVSVSDTVEDWLVGVAEAKIGRSQEEALAGIGYGLYDIDGNGGDELIIADTGEGAWNNRILAIYTIQGEEAVLVDEGWIRSRLYLLEDGTIFYEGSGGAAYTSIGIYRMPENGSELSAIDVYFTDYLDETDFSQKTVWFHNTSGSFEKDQSEVVDRSDEEMWKWIEELESQVMELDLTFFKEYQR